MVGGGVSDEMERDGDDMGVDDTSARSVANRKTPAVIARILAALREYPLLGRAARAGGISPSTLATWRHDDAELRAAVEEARDEGIERIELRAHEDAINGNDREGTLMRIFTLKRHRPEYRDNVTVRHEGGGQDARDAALLRRAMVEALGPYPEARAALAATLARLGGVGSGDVRPAVAAPGLPAGSSDLDVVDAEVVSVEEEGTGRGDAEAGAATRRRARGGEASPAASAVPSRRPPPPAPSNKGVGSFDKSEKRTDPEKDD